MRLLLRRSAIYTPALLGRSHSLKIISTAELPASTSSRMPADKKWTPPPELLKPMDAPFRLLFGPGPSNTTEEITAALGANMLGHLHPEFVKIMADVREGLKYVFKTESRLTFAVSGTGHAGMECAFVNLLETGTKILVVQIGIWGERAASLAKRMNADVHVVTAPLGEALTLEKFVETFDSLHPEVVFICHGDSSTGIAQPLDGFGQYCRKNNAILIVDTVASLGGAEFAMDDLLIDCVYSATQKVLNAPPGLAPIAFNSRAEDKIRGRKSPVASFYFDALLLGNYWACFEGDPPRYHHTAPISTVYSLRAALARVAREGIDETIARHAKNAQTLYKLLSEAGLEPFLTDPNIRLPCLTTIKVPENVDWRQVTSQLMKNDGIEVSGGLGPTVGKVFRIGTFGVNSDPVLIEKVVTALKNAIYSASSRL